MRGACDCDGWARGGRSAGGSHSNPSGIDRGPWVSLVKVGGLVHKVYCYTRESKVTASSTLTVYASFYAAHPSTPLRWQHTKNPFLLPLAVHQSMSLFYPSS